MRLHKTTLLKSLSTVITLVTVLILAQGQARADEVTITGFTSGTLVGLPQLTFTGNSNFINTTSLGFGALSGSNSLGSFFLSTSPGQLLGDNFFPGNFFLSVTITSPTDIFSRIPDTSFVGEVKGSVSPNISQGGVNIRFNNTPVVFSFNDGTNTGFFSLVLPGELFVQTGQSAALTAGTTGYQQNVNVPEPATLLLLGTGLTGIVAKLRKRRNDRARLRVN